MAVKPPDYANGIPGNSSQYAPEVWTDIQPSQNETISRNDMVYTSTVEYKGYYKAQSTGYYKFQLTGAADGFAWVSSADSTSDHIDIEESVSLVNDRSFGVRIPAKPANLSYWVFEDTGTGGKIGGTFPGYGYWPLAGYGTSGKWSSYFSGRQLGYNHGSFLPGDIRTYSSTSNTQYGNCPTQCEGEKAGPGWNNPEDTNFNTSDLTYPCDDNWNSRTCVSEGRGGQVFLSTAYIAGGNDKRGQWSKVDQQEPYIVWPTTQTFSTGLQKPERIQIYLTFNFKKAGKYKIRCVTRYGIKFFYTDNTTITNNEGGPKTLRKLDTSSGTNPVQSGGGEFTSVVFDKNANQKIFLVGSATGNQTTGDVGMGLEIIDVTDPENEKVVWDSSKLVSDNRSLIGISECGYHALLPDDQRLPNKSISEFYVADGWLGYDNNKNFVADTEVDDRQERSERDTRQYLWENCTALLYDGQNRPGYVYLRADDYYFIRVVVTNRNTGTGQGFAFQVVDPGSNSLQQVTFSGNGDPNADSTVGGGVGGSGIQISKDALCNSVLYAGGIPDTSTTFGVITQTGSVLNLSALGVPENAFGTEGQSESVNGQLDIDNPGDTGISSYIVPLTAGVNVRLAILLQGGENGIPAMTQAQKSAVRTLARQQQTDGKSLALGEFRNAITSQAVISYGSSGNYRYLYHAVGDVVRSICDDNYTLTPGGVGSSPGGGGGTGGGGGGTGGGGGGGENGECIDLNLQGLTDNQGLISISSTCLDDCKPYADYTPPTGFGTGAPDYVNYIGTLGNGGGYIPVPDSALSKTGKEYINWDDNGPSNDPDKVDVRFGRNISCWGLWTPDTLPSSTVAQAESRDGGKWYRFNGKILFRTINFTDGPGTDPNENIDPFVFIWISNEPGGPALGGNDFTLCYPPSTTSTTNSDGVSLQLSMTMEPVYLNTDKIGRTGVLYIGNTSGKKYLNMVPIKNANWAIDPTKSWDEPGNNNPNKLWPGDPGFEDMISTKDMYSKQYEIVLLPPDQECDENFNASQIIAGDPPGGGGGGNPEPHNGLGLPSYVDYNPEDDFFYGRAGFATDPNGNSTFRLNHRVIFEPCTIRSIPILIIPGVSHGTIDGVPRNSGPDYPGNLLNRTCPNTTQFDESWIADDAFFRPVGRTHQWISRVPGEWNTEIIVLEMGGNVEWLYRPGVPGSLQSFPYPFNVTEPTWVYYNVGSMALTTRPDPGVQYNGNNAQLFYDADFTNLWPQRGWYWITVKNQKKPDAGGDFTFG